MTMYFRDLLEFLQVEKIMKNQQNVENGKKKEWKNVRIASLSAIAVFAVLFLFVSPSLMASAHSEHGSGQLGTTVNSALGKQGVLGAIPKASEKLGPSYMVYENPHGDQIAGFQFDVIAPFSST